MEITDTLFDWVNWDALSDEILDFYDCTLKVPIGPFNIGEVVETILIDFEHGYIQLFGDPERTGIRGRILMHEQKVRLALVD